MATRTPSPLTFARDGAATRIEVRTAAIGRAADSCPKAMPKVLAGTAPDGFGLPPGRLSITVRETGLAAA